ncbi:hypothetical protein L1049_002301 [Liquidambar formosana]|uniref:Protein kinase domain-containing protein n=1 Tax=Liquidambar formosana TaxID=63359 RepID=A0AAP0R862_LIQFO
MMVPHVFLDRKTHMAAEGAKLSGFSRIIGVDLNPNKFSQDVKRENFLLGQPSTAQEKKLFLVDLGFGQETNEKVVIKKINNTFENRIDTLRTLRELKLSRHIRHKNVIALKDVMMPIHRTSFKDVYLVYELMDTDLDHIIKSLQPLSNDHCKYFIFQIEGIVITYVGKGKREMENGIWKWEGRWGFLCSIISDYEWVRQNSFDGDSTRDATSMADGLPRKCT